MAEYSITNQISIVYASAYVSEVVPQTFYPDGTGASSICSWGTVSVGIAFSFATNPNKTVFLPDSVTASATSSSARSIGTNIAPVYATALSQQDSIVTVPTGSGEGGLKFFWG